MDYTGQHDLCGAAEDLRDSEIQKVLPPPMDVVGGVLQVIFSVSRQDVAKAVPLQAPRSLHWNAQSYGKSAVLYTRMRLSTKHGRSSSCARTKPARDCGCSCAYGVSSEFDWTCRQG